MDRAALADASGTSRVYDQPPDAAPGFAPTRLALEAAKTAMIEIAWLPFRSPELNPCEDLWRLLKSVIAANRAYASLEEEAE